MQPGRGDIRYNLAIAYLQSGDTQKAELELRKMLFVLPDSAEGHLALGTLLLEAGNNEDAAKEFHRVLLLQPSNREAAQLLTQAKAAPSTN